MELTCNVLFAYHQRRNLLRKRAEHQVQLNHCQQEGYRFPARGDRKLPLSSLNSELCFVGIPYLESRISKDLSLTLGKGSWEEADPSLGEVPPRGGLA